MTTLNNRVTSGEGDGEQTGAGLAGDTIVGAPWTYALHGGSALTFHTTDMAAGELLVRLSGEIDASNSGWLSGRLTTAITGHAAACGVVVDVTGIGFCDASGISVLVKALKQCRRNQIALELAGAQGKVARVLRLTGVDQALPLHADLDGALHAIAHHRSASARAPSHRPVPARRSEGGGSDDGEGSDEGEGGGAADGADQW